MPIVGSFLKGLYFGHIEEELLFPYPRSKPAEREQVEALVAQLLLAGQPLAEAAARQAPPSPADWQAAVRPLGLFGLAIPPRFGGLGLSTGSWIRLLEELSRLDPSAAVSVGTHVSLGTQGLLTFGLEEQKQRWLPGLAQGEPLAAFALTEADAGSDVAALACRAVVRPDGSYQLSGTKVRIINGADAGLFTVFARVSGRPGDREGITAFLVPRGEGVLAGPPLVPLGLQGCGLADVHFDGVVVPRDLLLGPVGSGFKVALETLNKSRLAVAAGCVGLCKRIVEVTLAYARRREAFGQPLLGFGLIQAKIGQMAVDTFVMESLAYLTAGLIDAGRSDTSTECAVAKVFASETTWRVANDSLQIAGGVGLLPQHPFAGLLRDARALLSDNGTNEILRLYIAQTGLAGPLEFLRSVAAAVRRPLRSAGLLADYALAVFNRRWKQDTVSLAHEGIAELAGPLATIVARFGAVVEELLRRHGEELTQQQLLLERLANVTIDLLASFAVLARTSALLHEGDGERAREALSCSSLFLAQAGRRLQATLAAIPANEDELLRDVARTREKIGERRATTR